MIESIGTSTSLVSNHRTSSVRPARLHADTLTAVQQSRHNPAGAAAQAVRVFAVPQAAGPASTPALPRGSLVDVLA